MKTAGTVNVEIIPEVIGSFYSEPIVHKEMLNIGKVNKTYVMTDILGEKSILQQISPLFDETMADDYAVVSEHLIQNGWEMATQRPSKGGEPYYKDNADNLWRSFSFLDSDPTQESGGDVDSVFSLSSLLGELHKSLNTLQYEPVFAIPHFHDTRYYEGKLQNISEQLPTDGARAMASAVVANSTELEMSKDAEQVIHGDPKLSNALSRNGKFFTFIDFDTVMVANPLVDVGDMLRSIAGKLVEEENDTACDITDTVIENYYNAAEPGTSDLEFRQQAIAAGMQITLELGMRYLIDSVEEQYFAWDPKRFATQALHNQSRANRQWRAFQFLEKML